MEPEADRNVLQHLLNLEAQASNLVEDAKAEAERRLSEGEKVCRANYDEAYSAEVEILEAAYKKEVAAIREDYKKLLDAYKSSLTSCTVNGNAFKALTERLFFGEG